VPDTDLIFIPGNMPVDAALNCFVATSRATGFFDREQNHAPEIFSRLVRAMGETCFMSSATAEPSRLAA
jgi:hypothetical protein